MKPNCYECKFRRSVPGDAHSMCAHPKGCGENRDPISAMIEAIDGGLGDPAGLGIKANPHGVSAGWFMWPFNFDPIWLESCNGFEKRGG